MNLCSLPTLGITSALALLCIADVHPAPANPILAGADPHAVVVGDTVWIYPTWSDDRRGHRFFAFSSTNLTDWRRHGPVLDFADVNWINDDGSDRHFAWAPGVLAKDGKSYFYYHRWDNQIGDGPYNGRRQTCIDRVEYDANGLFKPIKMDTLFNR